MCVVFFFFVKQKTADEMRISDWSSDVCSSDLAESALLHDDADRDADAGTDEGAEIVGRIQDARGRAEREAGGEQHDNSRNAQPPGEPLRADADGADEDEEKEDLVFHR